MKAEQVPKPPSGMDLEVAKEIQKEIKLLKKEAKVFPNKMPLVIKNKQMAFDFENKLFDYQKKLTELSKQSDFIKKVSKKKSKKKLTMSIFPKPNFLGNPPPFLAKDYSANKVPGLGQLLNDYKVVKKLKKSKKDKSILKFKLFQKTLQNKIKNFKSTSSKKMLKSMENKIQKISLKLKESQKSVLASKKSNKSNSKSKSDKILFPTQSATKRKEMLSKLNETISTLLGRKYSADAFSFEKKLHLNFTEGLEEVAKREADKFAKVSFSKLLRNLKEHYDSSKESLPLEKCLSKE